VSTREGLRSLFLVLVTLLVQQTLALDVRIAGAHPDVMLALPIAAGLVGGPEKGALVGFAAGVATDLFLPTPFGLSALVYCLVGFAVGQAAGVQGDHSVWVVAPGVAVISSAIAVMLYAVLGALLGQNQMLKVDLAAVVLVVSLPNALVAMGLRQLFGRTFGRSPSAWRGDLVAGDRL